MPGPPIALRTFPQNDEVVLFAEVYDNAGSTPHKVDITATVTADEGKVMFTANEVRDSSDLGGQRGGYGYTTKIPMKDLAPGSYVLKVEAKSRLANTPPVSREVSSGSNLRGRERPDDGADGDARRRAAAAAGCAAAASDAHDGAGHEDDRQRRSQQHGRREAGR